MLALELKFDYLPHLMIPKNKPVPSRLPPTGFHCFHGFFKVVFSGLSWLLIVFSLFFMKLYSKELDFEELVVLGYLLGVLGFSDLLGMGAPGYSDLLGLGVPD